MTQNGPEHYEELYPDKLCRTRRVNQPPCCPWRPRSETKLQMTWNHSMTATLPLYLEFSLGTVSLTKSNKSSKMSRVTFIPRKRRVSLNRLFHRTIKSLFVYMSRPMDSLKTKGHATGHFCSNVNCLHHTM